jgi:DNA-binding transcriptional MerR regulator
MVATDRAGESLDSEWLALIMEAKNLGISMETVRNFLEHPEFKDGIVINN